MVFNLWTSVEIYGKFVGFVDRTKYILKQSENRRILHVGCADYPVTEERIRNGDLLHSKITDVAKDVLGIDNSVNGIEILHRSGFNNVKIHDAENIKELGTRYEDLGCCLWNWLLRPSLLRQMKEGFLYFSKVCYLGFPQGWRPVS